MDLLEWFDSTKLLINGKFKYFHYNTSSGSLELLPGHFLNGVDFDCSTRKDNVCVLKINNFELKYDENNGQITTRKDVIGSSVILEPFDNISFYLKHFDGYFDEELKLVEKQKAAKIQALWTYEADKLIYPREIPSTINNNDEASDNLLSIEGLPIAPNSQQFQIILDGNSCDYANEFEGQLLFSNDTYSDGDKFQLVKINNKLILYNSLYGYLGRGTNEYGSECIMYYDEIPDNLAYLEKHDDNGMYLMRCSDGVGKEDDYMYIDWVKASCGFSDFTSKKEEASVLQFTLYYENNSENVSNSNNPVSKL